MINVRYLNGRRRRRRPASLGGLGAPGPVLRTLENESIGMQVPQVDVQQVNYRIAAQPPNLPAGMQVLEPSTPSDPTPGAGDVGGGETEVAYFIYQNEMNGGSDPTTGQQNYESFVGPPYEAHRDDGSIEYIDPRTAVRDGNGESSWLRTWGPPLALALGIGTAVWVLRRPRRRRR